MIKTSRVLALDMSTKTGWAVLDIYPDRFELIDAGTLEKISEPDSPKYPVNYLNWARSCCYMIEELVKRFKPDEFVIEETAKGSKNNMSQKIVEFIHAEIARFFEREDRAGREYPRRYYLTEEWRRICGCKMNKEEKKQNADVRKYKKKHKTKLAYDKEGKRIGIVGKKHVNVRRANEVFDLELLLKDEDRADALLLAYALYLEKYNK